MEKISMSHGNGGQWRGTVPAWWLGASLIAGVYVFMTPRFLPDIVPEAANNPPLRWLVGLVVGVAILLIWQVGRRLFAKNPT